MPLNTPFEVYGARSIGAGSEFAFVRTTVHLRTTRQVRALPIRRLTRRAAHASTDPRHAQGQDLARRAPMRRPRPVSTSRPAAAMRQPPPPGEEKPIQTRL